MEEGPKKQGQKHRWAVFLLLMVSLASHCPILTADFVWDDVSLVRDNPTLRDVRFVPLFFIADLGKYNLVPREMGFYRPLQSASFFIDRHLYSGEPWGFHLGNLLIHAMAVLALFGMALRLGFSFSGALAAGALFAVLPGKSEEVFFIANRGGVMAAMFSLVSLWAHLTWVERQKTRYSVLSLTALALGLLSKETPIAIPAAIGLTTLFFFRTQWKEGGWRLRWNLAGAGHWIVALAYLGWRFGVLGIYGTSPRPDGGIATALYNLGALLLKYLRLLAFPVGLTPEHGFDFANPVLAWTALCGWAGILILAGFTFLFIRRAPAVPYGLLLFGLLMSPLVNLIPIDRPFSEHYLYLPAAGFCLSGAALGQLAFEGRFRKFAAAVGVLVVLLFAGTTYRAATWWKDSCTLWERAYAVKPTAWVLNNLGTCHAERGDAKGAAAFFRQAQELDPGNYKAAYNLALDAIRLRNWSQAKGQLEFALKLQPDYLRAALALGVLAYHEGKSTDELILSAKSLTPRWVESLLGYAHAARKEGDNEKAEQAVLLYQQSGGKGIFPPTEKE